MFPVVVRSSRPRHSLRVFNPSLLTRISRASEGSATAGGRAARPVAAAPSLLLLRGRGVLEAPVASRSRATRRDRGGGRGARRRGCIDGHKQAVDDARHRCRTIAPQAARAAL